MRSVQTGTGGATSMTVKRADNEFSSATMAGCAFVASSPVGESLGHRHGWPPKIVLSLISCFRHKGFFFRSFSNRKRITKARYCKDGSYKRARGGRPLGRARITLTKPEFPILHDLVGAGEVAGLVPGGC